MDRITETQLGMFCVEYGLEAVKQDVQFEHFSAFSTIRRHYDRTFTPSEVVVDQGGDTGIDAVAIIVNNVLVTDVDQVEELATQNGYVDATFIFVQAETSSSFDGKKITNVGVGVVDFFASSPKLVRNQFVSDAAAIATAVYNKLAMFRSRPSCICYYVTTGKWVDDANLNAYRTVVIKNLENDQIFSRIEFHCFGADEIQRAYNQTRNPISRDFLFSNRTDIPQTPGVGQAFLGFIPYGEFRRIVSDPSGNEILGSIFESNVRDWQDYSTVNKAIQGTLQSDAKSRFVLMNNGITIIARTIKQANHRFTIEDFQIVNGCQTSHVVFNEKGLDDNVCIPLRLIETRDEGVMESIIQATNNQSPLRPEPLYALMNFSKKLETFFQTYDMPHTLYYERRDGQYDRQTIQKVRIVVPANAIKAFGAMFLDQPHRTTRGYGELRKKVGDEIFGAEHRLEPYYASSYAFYRLDWLFRNDGRFTVYKPARFHILLAVRLLVNGSSLPQFNSRDMEMRANEIIKAVWDEQSDSLFLQAAKVVNEVADSNMESDHIRRKPITDSLLQRFGLRPAQE